MPDEPNPFDDLIRRVRAGDEQAATELVRLYEPAIRRAVRVRLVDDRLTRFFDSMDICQSVFGSFFLRVGLGQFDLRQPDDVLKLLVDMARKKLATAANKERAGRRDHRRLASAVEAEKIVAGGASPSEEVSWRELLAKFREGLSPEERYLADQRSQGRTWADIAADLGANPEALRKQLARAIERVAQKLELVGVIS